MRPAAPVTERITISCLNQKISSGRTIELRGLTIGQLNPMPTGLHSAVVDSPLASMNFSF